MTKELALVGWLLIIQLDVIRNLSVIEVDHRSPVYLKTTGLRMLVGLIFLLTFYFYGTPSSWVSIAIMQICVYGFAFSIPLNVARRKHRPLLYMGTKSLPERIFAGRNIVYLWVKIWLFVLGLLVLYYSEIVNSY